MGKLPDEPGVRPAGRYYEPWVVVASPTGSVKDAHPDDPEGYKEWVAQQQARLEKEGDHIIRGTGVWEPGFAVSLFSNDSIPIDSSGILVTITPCATKDGRIAPREFAERIAWCVNFCQGLDAESVGHTSLSAVLAELQAALDGHSRETINRLFVPRWPPGPEMFKETLSPPKARASAIKDRTYNRKGRKKT